MSLIPASKLPRVGRTIFSVMTERAEAAGAINLSQGFPDFDVPEALRGYLAEAVAEGWNQYAPSIGVAALREAIAGSVAARDGVSVDPEREITVTSGATEALFDAMQAFVTGGDEVIILDPAYDAYEAAVTLAGGRAVRIPLTRPDFAIDWDRFDDALRSRTRMVVINTPHNPSGAVLGRGDLQALADRLGGTDTLVLSDEVYEHMVFDGARHLGALAIPELRERTLVVSSFGKTCHCTGWKVGYCIAPVELSAEFRKVHQYVTFSTMTAAQVALARFTSGHPSHHEQLPAFYEAKRDRMIRWLKRAGFALIPAAGTYFQIADYSALSDRPDTEFAMNLIDRAGVAAIPVSVFEAHAPPRDRYLRFCFAKTDATLDAAGERLCNLSG